MSATVAADSSRSPRNPSHPPLNINDRERIASIVGGIAFAGAAAVRRSSLTPFLFLAAGYLIHRGVTGHCKVYDKLHLNTSKATTGVADHAGIRVEKSIEIGRPATQVFDYWRRLSNLPKFMPHLLSVEEIDRRLSRWRVAGPAGTRVEWTAEIINEHPGSLIAWQTLPGAEAQSAGSVRFDRMNLGERTKVTVVLEYRAPLGKVGDFAARLTGDNPGQRLSDDLARFKTLVETDSDALAPVEM